MDGTNEHSRRSSSLNQRFFAGLDDETYRAGSPHLRHEELGGLYADLLDRVGADLGRLPRRARVVDVGAGTGVITKVFLERGWSVTAVDSSAPMLAALARRCVPFRDRLTLVCDDAEAALERLPRESFDLVSLNAFLHHVPDYVALLKRCVPCVSPGGWILTFADPLRYDTLGAATLAFGRAGYFWWRIFRGNYLRGIRTRLRRLAGRYDTSLPEDMAEYHVVRGGVDAQAILDSLAAAGFAGALERYFSSQSLLFEKAGRSLGLVNSFAVLARRIGRDP